MMNASARKVLNGNVVIWHYVKDLSQAIEWYSNVLGIQPTGQIDVACFFNINEHTKLALSNRFKADESNLLPVSAGLDLQSEDVLAAYQLLKDKGVQVEKPTNPLHTYHEFYFCDPDRNQIRVHGFVRSTEATE